MCIICASAAGVRQPDAATLRRMFINNPHGAGFMYAREGKVTIEKGFMRWDDFARAVKNAAFTAADPVVYHFRISTQAGVNPGMTHPFPLTADITKTRELDVVCPVGVAHNGIVRMTSDFRDKVYSDTAHYIAEFMAYLIRSGNDLRNPAILDAIARMTDGSKWAIMDGSGYIATAGGFINDNGLLYSNAGFRADRYHDRGGVRVQTIRGSQSVLRGFYDDEPEYDDNAGRTDDLEPEDIDPETGEPWGF